MKISILLPYKENFSPEYPGAVSLFVKDTLSVSKYKNKTTVFGSTTLKRKFKFKYKNIPLNKLKILSSSSRYVKQFIKLERKNFANLIEIHNRPIYVQLLPINKSKKILYFHNDPLSMNGSKNPDERIKLINLCSKIVFNSPTK